MSCHIIYYILCVYIYIYYRYIIHYLLCRTPEKNLPKRKTHVNIPKRCWECPGSRSGVSKKAVGLRAAKINHQDRMLSGQKDNQNGRQILKSWDNPMCLTELLEILETRVRQITSSLIKFWGKIYHERMLFQIQIYGISGKQSLKHSPILGYL